MASEVRRDVVVIGASAGGVQALRTLLGALPSDLKAALFVVMHLAPESPQVLGAILDRATDLPVVTARDGMKIRPGSVVVAAADHHLLLDSHAVRLSHGPRENRHRPSVDVLFRSAAAAFGARVIGIVLTGLLDDGAAGLWAIKRRGGLAIVQDPGEAEYPDMPRSALQAVRADACLPLLQIARRLPEWTKQPVEAATEPTPQRMMSEVRMASDQLSTMEEMDTLGRRVSLTCPECGGALWEMDDGSQPRFRCHVGHAYSLLSLGEDQWARVEAAIWAALRALEENVRIAERMAQGAMARGQNDLAAFHQDRSLASGRHAQVIRDILEQAVSMPSARTEPESAV
jgi:two-component system, chemotaxis family, protein-glutamate methylesterase/glutaminase